MLWTEELEEELLKFYTQYQQMEEKPEGRNFGLKCRACQLDCCLALKKCGIRNIFIALAKKSLYSFFKVV